MTALPVSALLFALAFLFAPISHGQADSPVQPKADVRQLLQNFTGYSPDPCGLEPTNQKDSWDTAKIERPFFDRVSELILNALNTGTATPKERAAEALRNVERVSAEVNSAWPQENRFRFETLDLKEILVVEMSIRMSGRFFIYTDSPVDEKKPDHLWREISNLDDDLETKVPWVELSISALHSGPSGHPKFLVKSTAGGCAGSYGISYEVLQWIPPFGGTADKVIDIKGALGLDDKAPGFPQIGKLHTDGSAIDLPYCWWTPIDTWDNPSMCAIDRYDLSGDDVRFVSRRVNRPDLLPVAQALAYADKRDFGAVRGYCASDSVAHRLVERAPRRVFEVEIKVKRLDAGRELVFEESGNYSFTVEKHGARWLIAGFNAD